MQAFPVTRDQYDRYQRRARARVIWGHRPGGIVDSLVRKGVKRQEATEIVSDALREQQGAFFKSGLIHAGLAGVAALIATLVHAPQFLRGGAMEPWSVDSVSAAAWPFVVAALVFGATALTRWICAAFRWF